jgi:protein-S-isoprenylcysteine O-methyltransferase Ste14
MAIRLQAPTRAGLTRAGVDVSLAAFYLVFATIHVRAFLATHRPSLVFVVGTELLFALFFLLRSDAEDASRAGWDWAAAVLGSTLPLLLRPAAAEEDVLVGQVLQVAGYAGSTLGIATLARSVGVIPATRAIKSGGAYRIVRHPLYASYTLANLGYLVSNRTAWNGALVAIALAAQVARVFNEERWLARSAEYRAYMARTRWRLVTFVF